MRRTGDAPPHWPIRLGLWLAIYIAAQIPFITALFSYQDQFNLPLVIVGYPGGLGMIIALPLAFLLATVMNVGPFFGVLAMLCGYLLFALNLTGVLRAQTRHRMSFLLLLEVTMILVSQNIYWGMLMSRP